jgi:hypothetical protein
MQYGIAPLDGRLILHRRVAVRLHHRDLPTQALFVKPERIRALAPVGHVWIHRHETVLRLFFQMDVE